MPFLTGFGKRKEIRYGTVFPGANLTDFPKLFKIAADSDIAAELGSGGGIAITLADETTEVPFGLYPSSNPATGNLTLRAKFSPLTAASTGDVLGYIYYDAGETTVEDKSAVVSNGYALFMPLEEDPSGSAPQMFDWVTETNVGTSAGTMTSGDLVAGEVANGLDLDGSDDVIAIADRLVTAYPFTLSANINAGISGTLIDISVSGASNVNYSLVIGSSGQGVVQVRNGSTFASASGTTNISGGLARLDGVFGSNTAREIFVNGVSEASDTTSRTYSASTDRTYIGARADSTPDQFLDGIIDEVSVSSVARSADWIEYSYEDDFNNSDTFTLGAEEVDGGGGVSVTPGTATLTLTTFAPTVSTPRTVTPGAASLTTTAYAPTVATPVVCTPGAASITTTGLAPTIVNPKSATPGTAELTLTTFAPTVTVSGNQVVTPGAVSLTITTFAPEIGGSQTATPDTAALSLTTFAPTVSTPRVVVPAVATLSLTEFAPTISTPVVCTPGRLSLVITSYAPNLGDDLATLVGQWTNVIQCRSANRRIECVSKNRRIDTL